MAIGDKAVPAPYETVTSQGNGNTKKSDSSLVNGSPYKLPEASPGSLGLNDLIFSFFVIKQVCMVA